MLVEHADLRPIGADLRLAARGLDVDDLGLASQGVAGEDRLQPPEFVHTRRSEPCLRMPLEMLDQHRHRHRAGMPAARRQPPEMCLRRRLVGEMEGLRIIFPSEFQHLLARHLIGAEAALRADDQILEIVHRTRPLRR